jgi:glycosyltransferase involved in cell wall biosynthesis
MSLARDRISVVVVGHGPPTSGGIPSFVMRITQDAWLAKHCAIDYLNTAPRAEKRPGAFTGSNVGLTFAHAWKVFHRARRTDIVHLNLAATPTLPLIRAFVLTAAARLAGARVILHAHTGLIEDCVRNGVFRSLLRLELRVAATMIVVSRAAESAARPFGRVNYLANGVDPAAFSTGPKDGDPALVLFVGTIAERKGLIDLRDALIAMRSGGSPARLRVVIVGDGAQEGPGAFERVRRAYASAGLADVEFTGALGHDRIAELLARTDIFCIPSHSEGFPLSILEAMASEAALVATAVGDVPAMLGGGEAGVVVPIMDPDALSGALDRLARDRGERRRLGAAARRRVELEYSQQRLVERLFALYTSVATNGRRSKSPAPDGSDVISHA